MPCFACSQLLSLQAEVQSKVAGMEQAQASIRKLIADVQAKDAQLATSKEAMAAAGKEVSEYGAANG